MSTRNHDAIKDDGPEAHAGYGRGWRAIFGFQFGLALGVFVAFGFHQPRTTIPHRGRASHGYSPSPSQSCDAPTHIRERSRRPRSRCIVIPTMHPQSATAMIKIVPFLTSLAHVEISVSHSGRRHGPSLGKADMKLSDIVANGSLMNSYYIRYFVTGLAPDVDYSVELSEVIPENNTKVAICRSVFSTPPNKFNLIRNPGFERAGASPFLATRFHRNDETSPSSWTPFYNGGMRVICGGVDHENGDQSTSLQPRSGYCHAQFGVSDDSHFSSDDRHYGAHQAVAIPAGVKAVRVGIWYRLSTTVAGNYSNTKNWRTPSMDLGWQLSDGSLVDATSFPLKMSREANRWHFTCAVIKSSPVEQFLQMVHVYVHLQQTNTEILSIDDVSLVPIHVNENDSYWRTHLSFGYTRSDSEFEACYVPLPSEETEKYNTLHKATVNNIPLTHLRALVRPRQLQLTLAVPLTADRILRLETMSKLYGGGPIAAAVLVRSEIQVRVFTHIWKRRPWLRKHVDITFVYMPQESLQDELVPINALRNVALQLTVTEFVMMLDVDMTPATKTFACFRDPHGKVLSQLLPRDVDRILTVPVFVADAHVHPASTKGELLHQLHHRVATAYCYNSQKAVKMDKWYLSGNPYETRFMTDFEPYGICRRSRYPLYDERFVGYGFNKISWAWAAEMDGKRLFVLSDSFVSHLNHVDNKWVSHIGLHTYLRTWQRYYAFVAEKAATHFTQESNYIAVN